MGIFNIFVLSALFHARRAVLYVTPPLLVSLLALLTLSGCPEETEIAPVASFTVSPTSGEAPLTIILTDTSIPGSASIAAWLWDFGDGGVSLAQNPSHTYTAAGTYTISLTVINPVGGDETSQTITVSAAPISPSASFTLSPASGEAPLTVVFSDTSAPGSASIAEWAWNFGDGGTSAEQNPSHIFNAAGTYTVSLTVITAIGSGVASQTIAVSAPSIAPEASFTASPTSGEAPLTILFTDTSTPGSVPISAWLWDFGDGGVSLAQNPSHTYTAAGTYTISLTVINPVGSDDATQTITVSAAPIPPSASFTLSPASGEVPLTVAFTDTSTEGDASIDTFSWDFGDGETSAERNPSHIYTAAGTYTVSLTVANSIGADTQVQTGCVAVTEAQPSGVWHVTENGSGNGSSWDKALASIQEAVDAASDAGGGEVWVAAGTYTAANSYENYVVAMAEDVHLYGGFAGTETTRDTRDWENNATTIDGQNVRTGVLGADNATLDGFVIQNGHSIIDCGGGMYNCDVSPAVVHCTFANNYADSEGGGIFNGHSASPVITDCVFSENETARGGSCGGGIANDNSSTPSITGCEFISNTADSGGGMFNGASSTAIITNCTFTENEGSGIYNQGGGIYNDDASPIITDCIFSGNSASSGGGICNSSSSPTITNCTFSGNSAFSGGGMYNDSSSPAITSCTFSGNSVDSSGGGICNYYSSSPDLTNCKFTGNSTDYYGGGMCNNWSSSPELTNCTFTGNSARYGGGMHNESSSPAIMNCTFSGNSADSAGGGMYNYYSSSSPSVINCILWGESSGNEIFNNSATPVVVYSCVAGGYSGTGNIADDPLFMDASDDDYRLQPGSPCIDAGTSENAPDTDILGVARPQGSGYDMGAYER